MDHADKENLDGMLFAADIEKAFDSLEHNFLFATLAKFGFGPDFIRWIKVLFFDANSCVMNSGFSTGYFFTFIVGQNRMTHCLHIYSF